MATTGHPKRASARQSPEKQMRELLSGVLSFIVRAVTFALDVAASISDAKRVSRWISGSNSLVVVPAELKVLTPAAQRALAEAEQRHRFLYLPRRYSGLSTAVKNGREMESASIVCLPGD